MVSPWDWFDEKARAHRQNNSERPAAPQPEPFCVIRTRLGDANLNSGNIRGSYNTTTTYNMGTVAWSERARRDNFERLVSFPPTISTSVGNHNKGCGNIENSGGTNICLRYDMGTMVSVGRGPIIRAHTILPFISYSFALFLSFVYVYNAP